LLCDPTATSHHLTLVLHDALPISPVAPPGKGVAVGEEGVPIDLGEEPEFEELPGEAAVLLPRERPPGDIAGEPARARRRLRRPRSEEHTSELQSRENLVCRLLLEK